MVRFWDCCENAVETRDALDRVDSGMFIHGHRRGSLRAGCRFDFGDTGVGFADRNPDQHAQLLEYECHVYAEDEAAAKAQKK